MRPASTTDPERTTAKPGNLIDLRSWLPTITKRFPPNWPALQSQIESYAERQGLDFFPTIFECVEADELNAIAAYGGFPTRYPHWRFGMEYEQLSKGYHYGLQKIYELVINNNPCYAYLMKSQLAGRSEAGDVPRLRALRLLQEQRLLQPDQPQDDGRDGQSRQPHPPSHGPAGGGGGGDVHRRLPEHRGSDRHSLAVHQALRSPRQATTSTAATRTNRRRPLKFSVQGIHGEFHQSAPGAGGRGPAAEGRKAAPGEAISGRTDAGRDAVLARACPAQALAARRAVRSCETKPTTSPPKLKPRS